MAHFDLICKDCGHKFELVTGGAIRKNQKHCEECGSENIRQTFASFLQNGPLEPDLRRGTPLQRLRLRLLTRRHVAPSPHRVRHPRGMPARQCPRALG